MKYIVKLNIILFIMLSILSMNVYAKKEYKLAMCTLSEEYLEWEKLPNEEKRKTLMPSMCKINETQNKKYSTFSLRETEETLPERYHIKEQSYAPIMKNQQQTGSCWAFSTTTALEAFVKKKLLLDYQFSPRHIVYSNTRYFLNDVMNESGYNHLPSDGGNFFMSSNYLVNNVGPVLEEEMPFENREDLIDINELKDKNTKLDINNVLLYIKSGDKVCSTTERAQLKKYIMEYGTATTSTYIDGAYYNSSTGAYYNNEITTTNHAVTIVGWDDNYSKDNFLANNKPTSDGAWIIQNSYGSTFGDEGYYYISYEDINSCAFYMVIREAEQSIEDNMYVLDKLGFNLIRGYVNGSQYKRDSYAMNIFDKKTSTAEILKEVTLATAGSGRYRIYYTEGNGTTKSISDMTLIGSGTMDSIGYITHKLDKEIIIDNSVTQFSIIVYYYMDTNALPIPMSSSNSTFYSHIELEENRSFISAYGTTWDDISQIEPDVTYINSIRAATDNYIETITYQVNEEKSLIYVDLDTTQTQLNENIKVSSDKYENQNENTYKVYTGQKIGPYTVVVRGDVTGDGSAKMNDVMMISKYLVDGDSLTEDYLLSAADINKDSSIKMNDVMRISNYLVEGGNL